MKNFIINSDYLKGAKDYKKIVEKALTGKEFTPKERKLILAISKKFDKKHK